ncbi:hypothetical protein SAMN05421788_110149 [Filimonas lacunae]|uniref:Uncharacterized protein n=1 Tax=Filimonas lacunae TaxID=477680 RepID=A0A173MA52_9BACT|nr:hypothetical protein [Filimonas lacunae]BAV04417.1 hypothetical protein FLA_0408 [Filimonas lacunae]SIT31375.1 hypothetical protein SAMN05421788_110149 [Filimonas lacunae]
MQRLLTWHKVFPHMYYNMVPPFPTDPRLHWKKRASIVNTGFYESVRAWILEIGPQIKWPKGVEPLLTDTLVAVLDNAWWDEYDSAYVGVWDGILSYLFFIINVGRMDGNINADLSSGDVYFEMAEKFIEQNKSSFKSEEERQYIRANLTFRSMNVQNNFFSYKALLSLKWPEIEVELRMLKLFFGLDDFIRERHTKESCNNISEEGKENDEYKIKDELHDILRSFPSYLLN